MGRGKGRRRAGAACLPSLTGAVQRSPGVRAASASSCSGSASSSSPSRISKSASCRAEPARAAASLPSADSLASSCSCSRSCMCAATSTASCERSSFRSTRSATHAGLVQHGPSSGLGSAGFFRFRELAQRLARLQKVWLLPLALRPAHEHLGHRYFSLGCWLVATGCWLVATGCWLVVRLTGSTGCSDTCELFSFACLHLNRFVQGFNVCPLAFESEGVAVASSRANFDERLLAKVDLAGYAIYIHLSWVTGCWLVVRLTGSTGCTAIPANYFRLRACT